ncbi:MAG: flagellar filament capping protein FliD [Planctomycetes bacterium]|nr:flagellar filament capping protein FliD [Planctomycetota bacterium]
MSGISSGIGLASGLPTQQIIDSLLASQARPRRILTERLAQVQAQRTAFIELNARLVGLQSSVSGIKNPTFFNQFLANSSNEDVLTAIASVGASPGVVELTVKSLVTAQQMISGGFADADSTPVGAGEITIEIGAGMLSKPTKLGDLNGGAGVRRGIIEITDGAGNSAEINLTATLDIDDVLREINTEGAINVQARVDGNRIILEDRSGGTGDLRVVDLNDGFAVTDLGLDQPTTGGVITGSDIRFLADTTRLSLLNDGNGIRNDGRDEFSISSASGAAFNVSMSGLIKETTRIEVLNSGNGVRLGEIRITNRLGKSATIDLSGAQTVGDITALVAAATDGEGNPLGVEVSSGVGIGGIGSLTVTDTNEVPTDSEQELIIEDVTGFAARDLGIANSTTDSTFIANGIHRIESVGDVLRAINFAEGNDGSVVATLGANGIVIRDTGIGADPLVITALADDAGKVSSTAADLGIEGTFTGFDRTVVSRDLLAGLNTVLLSSLNGGSGLELGDVSEVSFATRDGAAPVTIDFAGAQTVQDIISRINSGVPGLQASLNSAGNGISLIDVSTDTPTGPLAITDVTGTLAAQLGIGGSFEESVDGENLQLQYMSERTLLEDLNGGRGVRPGTIEFQTTTGEIFAVDIDAGDDTLGKVISAINESGTLRGVTASINATGDGIVISDSNGGANKLTITDRNAGTAAKDLRIAGEAKVGDPQIDGSFEIRIDVEADDTLQDIATKLSEASPDLSASVINDGASATPFRLSLTSGVTGTRGELVFDAGDTGLKLNTLVAAQDAVMLIGGAGATSPLVVASSSNTVTDVLPGVDIELRSVSDTPISLAISRDIEGIVEDLGGFVTDYNSVMDRVDELTSFDPDTETRGLLLGDGTLAQIQSRLARVVIGRFEGAPPGTNTLNSVGITFGNGARLQFDEEKFREKYAENPTAVEQLFTAAEVGVGEVLNNALEGLSADSEGLLARRDQVLGDQEEDINDRIERIDEQLERRRAQLERQFANLESVISGLQGQQSSLAQLAQLAGGF